MSSQSKRLLSSLIITGLIVIGLVLFPGPALGATVSLEAGAGEVVVGEPITLAGSVSMPDEFKPFTSMVLSIEGGPEVLEGEIPLEEGTHTVTGPNVRGDLECEVAFADVQLVRGADYGYPAYAYGFKGFGTGASIDVDCTWQPPVFRDPLPIFSLVPTTEGLFTLPAIPPSPTPTPGGPEQLPAVTERFPIPLAPTPTPDPDAPDPLPSVTLAWPIPVIPTATPEAGAPDPLPTLTEAFPVPQAATPTPIAGTSVLPQKDVVFDLPPNVIPQGITGDGGTGFYVLADGATSGAPDRVLRLGADGTQISSFSLGYQCYSWADASCVPGHPDWSWAWFAHKNTSAIVLFNSKLFISEDEWDGDNGSRLLAFNPTTGALLASDGFDTDEAYGGLHADGSFVWGVRKDGDNITKLSPTLKSQLETIWLGNPPSTGGFAVNTDNFFGGAGDKIQRRNKTTGDQIGSDFTLTNFLIRGMTFQSGVLYIADAFGKVYKTQPPSPISVTTDPRAVAWGNPLYIVVDAQPVDKVLVVDPDTGALTTSYDAPDKNGDGLTLLGTSLYYAGKDSDGPARIYELDPSDGTVLNSFVPLWSWGGEIGDQPRALGNDGTDLLLTVGSDQGIQVIRKTDGSNLETLYLDWPDSNNALSGAAGLGVAPDGNIFLAKNAKLQRLNDEGRNILASWAGLSAADIKGLTFVNNILYLADDATNKIYKASIPSGIVITTDPIGLAYSNPLYILVEGEPYDRIEVVNATTGVLEDWFDAPDKDGGGLAYLDGFLYYGSHGTDMSKIYKLDPTDGTVLNNVTPKYIWGGEIWEDINALGVQGSNLLVSTATGQCLQIVDPATGDNEGEFCPPFDKALTGPKGVDSGASIIESKANKVVVASSQSSATTYTTTLSDIEGQAYTGTVLYLAEDGNNSVYKTSLPGGVGATAKPNGLAYDGTYLYSLVDASPADKVVKTQLDGTFVAAFDVTDGMDDFEKTGGIVALDGKVWVAVTVEPPFCCGRDQMIIPFLPDGTPVGGEIVDFSDKPFPWNDRDIRGLGTDGTDFFVGFDGAVNINRVDRGGDVVEERQFNLPGGVDSLAIRQGSIQVFVGDGKKIIKFDWDTGAQLTSWTTAISKVQGLTFVDSFLYIAEDTENKVFSAALPTTAVTTTTNPTGAASDGTNLWVIYDGQPKDVIVKLSGQGTYLSSFSGPSKDLGGMTYLDSSLYVGGNAADPWCPECTGPATIWQIDPTDGSVEDSFKIQPPWGGDHWNRLTALTNDGDDLIVGFERQPDWFLVSPSGGGSTSINPIIETGGGGGDGGGPGFAEIPPECFTPFPPPYCFEFFERTGPGFGGVGDLNWQSFEVVEGNLYALSNGDVLFKFEPSSGNDLLDGNPYGLENVTDVRGMAFLGATLHLIDASNDSVRGTTVSESQPEVSIAGDYEATLALTYNPTVTSPVAEFSIVPIPEMVVTITSPEDGATVGEDFIAVTGTVNDFSLGQVEGGQVILGLDLEFTTLFSDSAEDGDASVGKWTRSSSAADVGWHIQCDDRGFAPPGAPTGGLNYASDGDCSWHYARDRQTESPPGFETYNTPGTANSGTLTLADPIPAGPDTELFFTSWYDTDPGQGSDQKLVQASTDGGATWTTVAQIANFWSPPPGPDYFVQHPIGPFETAGFFGVPQPRFREVEVDLSAFDGQLILVRFKFDTRDKFVNDRPGWFVDDIAIEGSGGKRDSAEVPSCLVSGEIVTVGCALNEFAGVVRIGQGLNEIKAGAESPYATDAQGKAIRGFSAVKVFLDTVAPAVSITDWVTPTNDPGQVIEGEYEERRFEFLELTVENSLGTRVAFTQRPEDVGTPGAGESMGTFEAVVPMVEGLNTVTVTVTDKSGLAGSDTVVILVDETPPDPEVLAPVFPIGVFEARPGDPAILQLNATDLIGASSTDPSGIQCVELIIPGTTPALCAGELFLRPGDVPEAVRDAWGATGEHLLPLLVPTDIPTGQFSITARIVDNAGNFATVELVADVVPSLAAVNIGLLPGFNLKSLPLIPDNSDLTDILGQPVPVTVQGSAFSSFVDISFSPDGEQVAFAAGNSDTEIYVADYAVSYSARDTTHKTVSLSNVVQVTDNDADDSHPAWSADGQWLVFERVTGTETVDSVVVPVMSDLFAIQPDGTGEVQLTSAADGELWGDPDVNPVDGSMLAFNLDGDIYMATWSTGGATPSGLSDMVNLTDTPGVDEGANPAWSPDGQVIAFQGFNGTDYEIYTVNADGTALAPLTANSADDMDPAWAPDGEWLAFSSDLVGGSLHIHAVEMADPTNIIQITYDSGDMAPAWSPDDLGILHVSGGGASLGQVEPKLFQTIRSITTYDATGDSCTPLGDPCWHSYTPGEAPDDITELKTGRGYWVRTREGEFEFSAPLPGLTTQTPATINIVLFGQFLEPAVVPPVYKMAIGWNLAGIHSEVDRPVEDVLSGLSVPQRVWTSALVFKNVISFPIGEEGEEESEVEIILGSFQSLRSGDTVLITEGMWVFSNAEGTISP